MTDVSLLRRAYLFDPHAVAVAVAEVVVVLVVAVFTVVVVVNWRLIVWTIVRVEMGNRMPLMMIMMSLLMLKPMIVSMGMEMMRMRTHHNHVLLHHQVLKTSAACPDSPVC